MAENVKDLYDRARKAFEVVEFWPQDKVDEMVAAVAYMLQTKDVVEEVTKLAYEESGMGVYEHKVHKHAKIKGIMYEMAGKKTCGLIEDNKERGIKTYAKPMGVVANVVPCTNPTITTAFIGLSLLKTRNAMICSPHPRTKGSTAKTVEYARKALKAIGAPEDLFLCIEEPTNPKTVELMSTCDYAVATGGKALIKVVHAAGTPSVTVGAGNVRAIIDPSADIVKAADWIMRSKTFDNATSCSSENAVSAHESIYDEVVEELKKVGGYMCTSEERENLRAVMWPDGHTLNRDLVAKPAKVIADAAKIDIPDDIKFLMVEGQKIGPEDMFSNEKMSLILTLWKWNDFDTEMKTLLENLKFSGIGHSCALHSTKPEQWEKLAEFIPTGRVNINMGNTLVNSGSFNAGHVYTTTIGCGTWTGNSHSVNVNYKHFLNYTKMAVEVEEYVPTNEDVYGVNLAKCKELFGEL